MKITGQVQRLVDLYAQAKRTRQAEPSGDSGSAKADSVEFSQTAQEIKRLTSKLDQVPQVRQERVEAIKKAMAQGKYNVSADQVADRLLRSGALDDHAAGGQTDGTPDSKETPKS